MARRLCKHYAARGAQWYRRVEANLARFLLLLCTLVATMTVDAVRLQGPRLPAASVAPASPRQGEVVTISVTGASATDAVTGSVFGEPLVFDFDDRSREWRALAGIDVDLAPGTYPLLIRVPGGAVDPIERSITVAQGRFLVRRLSVAPKFVEPPAEELERIAAESKRLAAVYATQSPRQWTDAFVLPVDGPVTSNFGSRSYYNGVPRSPHAGVDFRGRTGTPVRAAGAGTVVLAESLYFTGRTVIVDHGRRLFSVFAHLSELHVEAGAQVAGGTIVGLIGATGRVTGPHLHWSIRLNGARVDPLSLVAATRR